MRPPLGDNQRTRDRAIMGVTLLVFAAWLVVMGLSKRFGWSHVPLWAQTLGAALIALAFWGFALVLRTNSFASVVIRVQGERGQTVASTGPYAVVRHPMYACGLLMMVGPPLLLGSLWGFAGLIVFLPLLAARSVGEEAVLTVGLPGLPRLHGKGALPHCAGRLVTPGQAGRHGGKHGLAPILFI